MPAVSDYFTTRRMRDKKIDSSIDRLMDIRRRLEDGDEGIPGRFTVLDDITSLHQDTLSFVLKLRSDPKMDDLFNELANAVIYLKRSRTNLDEYYPEDVFEQLEGASDCFAVAKRISTETKGISRSDRSISLDH